MTDRRSFLKKTALATAAAAAAPSLLGAMGRNEKRSAAENDRLQSTLIVPKENGLRITRELLK